MSEEVLGVGCYLSLILIFIPHKSLVSINHLHNGEEFTPIIRLYTSYTDLLSWILFVKAEAIKPVGTATIPNPIIKMKKVKILPPIVIG